MTVHFLIKDTKLMEISQMNTIETQKPPLWHGACAGALATFPMTLFMLATQRFLPKRQQYDLPPEIITKDLARKAHIKPFLSKRQILVATLFSHFGYGSAMGVLYRLLLPRPLLKKQNPFFAPVPGLLFGLVIWAGSYLGLLPLLGMSISGQREPGRRNLLMIAAHEVWGATLGVTMSLLKRKAQGS